MDRLYSPSVISDIQRRYGFTAAKSLGQNFLADKNTIDRIVGCAGIEAGDLVIEIGPGMGVLTAAAAEKAGLVVAIEIDRRLMPILEENLAGYGNIRLINADILKTDVNAVIADALAAGTPAPDTAPEGIMAHAAGPPQSALAGTPTPDTVPEGIMAHAVGPPQSALAGTPTPVKIIGNLPYYITNPIVMKLLEDGVAADSMTFMLQKEAAARICAPPGTPGCGAVSAAVSFYCQPHMAMSVSREVFVPRPNVDSSVIRLDIHKGHAARPISDRMFFAVVRAGFGQRRKTLLNSLTGLAGLSKGEIGKALEAAGISPMRRAETLGLQEIAAVADAICLLQASTRP
ncbi:MAG: 16S rRNA (adenine(1518)-N(6)/adenine(1519)-N(6))-dimethyltransferase [Clostridiales Family XIII bacterium]|jgi:16S rRNA (adenine1518-N6/adenine1519-N6)-dimethyltransferase|nr:16S rRNA (adenine(1518)-N(6)/adenine(1519)-N(6))-dimethyltransferase [Clostridiales Family XIII bacterium]